MNNITDITFNFDFFEDYMVCSLDDYYIAEEAFCEGNESEEHVVELGEETLKRIALCEMVVKNRLYLIKEFYFEDKNHDKNNLKKESLKLSKKLEWYGDLTHSISKELAQIKSGEIDFDDEMDLD